MSIDKLKTKFITGAFINDVKHYFTKINEIIDYLNGNGKSGDGSYKVYTALLTQAGTNEPIVESSNGVLTNKPLLNTFDSVNFTYSYISTGHFKLTSNTPVFTDKKTFISLNVDDVSFCFARRISSTEISIFTYDGNSIAQNDYLNLANFEIRVYN